MPVKPYDSFNNHKLILIKMYEGYNKLNIF